ncbi:hypothetical protein GCM10027294_42070 [Marinactinospora endophytica]
MPTTPSSPHRRPPLLHRFSSRAITVALVVAVAASALLWTVPPLTSPADPTAHSGDDALAAEVRGLLPDGPVAGLSVAVVEDGLIRSAAFGSTGTGSPVRPDTPFENGSTQKPLTAALFAVMLESGEGGTDTTIGEIWPDVGFAHPSVAAITLEELATHHSGLPRLAPQGLPATVRSGAEVFLLGDPYVDAPDPLQAVASLSDLPGEPGEYAYSNLGYALLGAALAERLGTDYPTALRERVLRPLGMTSTTLNVPGDPDPPSGAALPHTRSGMRTSTWNNADYLPAGIGTWSTAGDLALFLRAMMGHETPLGPALRRAAEPLRNSSGPAERSARTGLAWQLWDVSGRDVVWHNGQTGGQRSFVAHDGERGVVVMANSVGVPVEHLGMRMLGLDLAEFAETPPGGHLGTAALTLSLVLGAPLLTLVSVVRERRPAPRGLDRAGVVDALLTGGVVWLAGLALGDWLALPVLVWALGGGVLAGAVVLASRRWASLPALRGRRRWPRALSVAISVLVLSLPYYVALSALARLL